MALRNVSKSTTATSEFGEGGWSTSKGGKNWNS